MLDRDTFVPKGSMCLSCKYRKLDCSGLDFHKMKIIELWENLKIVKCDNYKNLDKHTTNVV